jgi:hypothetical protein
MSTVAERTDNGWAIPMLGLTLLGGLVAGVIIYFATTLLSRTDIGGPGWSMRGNGALIVVFSLGPALLAVGWVWLCLRSTAHAAIAGATTLAIELLFGFTPVLLGPTVALTFGLIIVSLSLALMAGYGLSGDLRDRGRFAGVVAAIVSLFASLGIPGLAYMMVAGLVPVVLATPVVAPRRSGRLLTECFVLLVAMFAGAFGAQSLFG